MFEDIKQPPDIFAETDKAENVPPPFRPPQPPTAVPSVPPITTPVTRPTPVTGHSFNFKPVIIVLGAVVIIAFGAWLSTKILGSSESVTENLTNVASNKTKESAEEKAAATNNVKEQTPAEVETEVVPETVVELDTDKDGLSDTREAELGTSPTSTDTDADGLFDLEEVEVRKTDPLNPDTDGDGYLDGAEVKSGYNPNGAGKLFEVPGNE